MNKTNTMLLLIIVAVVLNSSTDLYGMFTRTNQLARVRGRTATRNVTKPYMQSRQTSSDINKPEISENSSPLTSRFWQLINSSKSYLKSYLAPSASEYKSPIELKQNVADLVKESPEMKEAVVFHKMKEAGVFHELPKVDEESAKHAVSKNIAKDLSDVPTYYLTLNQLDPNEVPEELFPHREKLNQFYKDLDEEYQKNKERLSVSRAEEYERYEKNPERYREKLETLITPWFTTNTGYAYVKLLGLYPQDFQNQFDVAEKTLASPNDDNDVFKRLAYKYLIKKIFEDIKKETDPQYLAELVAEKKLTQENAAARIKYANLLYRKNHYLYQITEKNILLQAGLVPKGFMVMYRENKQGDQEPYVIKLPNRAGYDTNRE